MALDLQMALASASSDSVTGALRELVDSPWASVDGAELTLVRMAAVSSVGQDVRLLPDAPAARYGALEALGVVVIGKSATSDGTVLLSGGSVSTTRLDLNRMRVVKSSAPGRLNPDDGISRHRREARWLAGQRLGGFPSCVVVADSPDHFIFETDFSPMYTLGELIHQGRMDAERALGTIRDILEGLAVEVYPVGSETPQPAYVPIVRARLDRLSMEPAFDPLLAHLRQRGATINGQRTPPLDALLATADRVEQRLPRHFHVGRGCHGDLISDDILVSHDGGRTMLIDPNPTNVSPTIDLSKMLMSFEFDYESLIRDEFAMACENTAGTSPTIEWQLRAPDRVGPATDREIRQLLADPSTLWEHCGMSAQSHILGLNLRSALHILAIPLFHAVVQQKTDRATIFLAAGMARLAQVLQEE
jgi:hypothetical protein